MWPQQMKNTKNIQKYQLKHFNGDGISEKSLSSSKWCRYFHFTGVPFLHLDVFPPWFSGSCWWGGQRSLCQTTGPHSQPWWVECIQTHRVQTVACSLSCEMIWESSTIDHKYYVVVQSCCIWLLVDATLYPLVLSSSVWSYSQSVWLFWEIMETNI